MYVDTFVIFTFKYFLICYGLLSISFPWFPIVLQLYLFIIFKHLFSHFNRTGENRGNDVHQTSVHLGPCSSILKSSTGMLKASILECKNNKRVHIHEVMYLVTCQLWAQVWPPARYHQAGQAFHHAAIPPLLHRLIPHLTSPFVNKEKLAKRGERPRVCSPNKGSHKDQQTITREAEIEGNSVII